MHHGVGVLAVGVERNLLDERDRSNDAVRVALCQGVASMKNGQHVAAFEREFASYVGAKYAIALCNGTATLHTALVALGVKPGDRVAVPPLTMSATTIAVLHAGAVPVFRDVDERTWLMQVPELGPVALPVSLYGLHAGYYGGEVIDDAAQTLRPHSKYAAFTSYSFQASKILSLGEGGMLVTDDEELATRAREFSSLGYRMRADQPRIDPDALKSPTFDRHYSLGWNYRMSDLVAAKGNQLIRDTQQMKRLTKTRRDSASLYRDAIAGCDWLTPQHVPDGWQHDMWTFAVACDTPQRALDLSAAVVKHGSEKPYPAWRLTYEEPAFTYLDPRRAVTRRVGNQVFFDGEFTTGCPVAESLQPRLLQFQTNDLASAERNATALRRAIEELS